MSAEPNSQADLWLLDEETDNQRAASAKFSAWLKEAVAKEVIQARPFPPGRVKILSERRILVLPGGAR